MAGEKTEHQRINHRGIPASRHHYCKLGRELTPHRCLYLPQQWLKIRDRILFQDMWLFWCPLFCCVLFLYICRFSLSSLAFLFVSTYLKKIVFYICSPNCQLISCSTSESVSPVKQAPRKSPSDTEGLVKSLPSGSHQVTADCGSAHHAMLCSWGLCHFPGHRKEYWAVTEKAWETDRQLETERDREREVKSFFRRTTHKYVEKSLTWVKLSTKPPLTHCLLIIWLLWPTWN